ncbi:MAG TPA: TIGR03118 family protein [Candidatus Methylomirabilis sp.]|nr:TIGR03118 family protein [Candidatus Methylomirabilis sp.]
MEHVLKSLKVLAVAGAVFALYPAAAQAQHYTQTNLVSNVAGNAPLTDPNLQNAWGLVSSPTGSPWWVSNNAGGTSTLYSIDSTGAAHLVPINPSPNEFVAIPNAPSQTPPGSPTGVMFNGSATDFLLAPGKPAVFIFVTEDGTVQGWNPGVNRASAVIVVDHSQVPTASNGAVYKGATIAEIEGQKLILAANFRSGRIDVFNSQFKQVKLSEEKFEDDELPRDFAPFNVQGVGPNIYVTYARQDAAKHDPPDPGRPGDGFVDVFNRHGRLIQRLEHGDWFNAPWGVVWATPDFGEFSNTILVGNFRGGNVSAFNPVTGRFLGNMLNPDGSTLLIDGLWALRFGNDGGSGPATTLFFTAGPNHETDGLLGTLTPVAAEKAEADEQ